MNLRRDVVWDIIQLARHVAKTREPEWERARWRKSGAGEPYDAAARRALRAKLGTLTLAELRELAAL